MFLRTEDNKCELMKWTKAIQSYLVSTWSWASQWNILLHWCTKLKFAFKKTLHTTF